MSAVPQERQRFGRYETLFRIAGGGMAEVYAARALGEGGFQKLVALKRMRPELAEDARFVAMFLDEGRLAANIASPNVVSTLDLGRADDNSLFLVMELVIGVALSQLIQEMTARSSTIPVPLAVDLIARTAQGLHAAHEARSPLGDPLEIVHRDCSPHNILVDINGQVKITDFGIAKAMERQTQSHAGEMKGKLCYLSPEQARGRDVDRRTDIFILGIVAWEVLAGRMLFDADNPVEALHKVATMPIPNLTDVRPDISSGLSAAVAQALARDPDGRYSTAAAFGNALHHSLGTRPPAPDELGQFVRRFGGPSLQTVQQRIRETLALERGDNALSGVREREPLSYSERPKSSAEYPIPLKAKAAPRADTVADIDVEAAAAARQELLGETGAGASGPLPGDFVRRDSLAEAPAAEAALASLPPPAASVPPPAAPSSVPPPAAPRSVPPPADPSESRSTVSLDEIPAAPRPAKSPRPLRMPETARPTRRRRSKLVPIGIGLVLLAGTLGALGAWVARRPAEVSPPPVAPDPPPLLAVEDPQPRPTPTEADPVVEATPAAEPPPAPEPAAQPALPVARGGRGRGARGRAATPRGRTRRTPPEESTNEEGAPSRLEGNTPTVHGDRFEAENEIWND